MKGIAAPLAALEGNALPLSQEGAEGEESTAGEGFDALLALVNAQAPNGLAPVKVLAPSVGVQCAPVAASKDGHPSAAAAPGPKGPALDVVPTQVFLPWLGAPDAVQSQIDEQPGAAVVDELLLDGATPQPSVTQPELPAQSTQPTAPAAPAVTQATAAPDAREPALKSPAQRKSAPRDADERGDQPVLVVSSPLAPNMMAPQLAGPAPAVPPPEPAAQSASATNVAAPTRKQRSASIAPAASTSAQQELVPADGFAELLAVDGTVAPRAEAPETVVDEQASPQLQRSQAAQANPAREVKLPLSDAETQARVTKIEFFRSAEAPAASEPLPADVPSVEPTREPEQLEAAPTEQLEAAPTEQLEAAPTEQHEASAGGEQSAADQRAPSDPSSGEASQPSAAQVARFEVTEGKGMRGLDAVVASLLRPYADKPEASGGVRVPTVRVAHVSVETGKSQSVKLEERTNVTQALDAAALRRQEEERRGELVELAEPATLHMAQQPEPQAEPAADAPPAQATAVNVPAPPPPDPDAALMGKIARGESLNAAISIEHPELGSMDVLVQNENGRIDVRATLETPRAAAVLRAHESALRYGVQQAGMTFGALRVNARTGETKMEKSRDVPKRRRDRDWEA